MQKDFPHTASYNRFVELNERFGINALVFLLSILHPFEAAISKEKSSIKPSRNLLEKGKVHGAGSMDSNCT